MSTCTKTPRRALVLLFPIPRIVRARGITRNGFRPLFSWRDREGAGACAETPGNAQTAENEKTDDQKATQLDQPITLEEVPNRAETTTAELATLLPLDSSRRTLERVSAEADHALQKVQSHLAKARQMLAGRPNVRTLQRSSAELSEMLDHLRSLEEELDDQLDGFGTSLGRIDKIAAVWVATDELAKTEEGADATMLKRIAAVLGEIDETRSAVVDRRNESIDCARQAGESERSTR